MRLRRLRVLEYKARTIAYDAFDLECKQRSANELEFFNVHGSWPEGAEVSEREERSFTTHGLRTTIILERVQHHEEDESYCQTRGKNIGLDESIRLESFVGELTLRTLTPEEEEFILLHGCGPEQIDVSEPIVQSFTTHGLKTTVILEPLCVEAMHHE